MTFLSPRARTVLDVGRPGKIRLGEFGQIEFASETGSHARNLGTVRLPLLLTIEERVFPLLR
jgi:hypothetical protein